MRKLIALSHLYAKCGNKANIANISPNVKLLNLLKSSAHYLQDSEVFKNTVHHVFFRQMLEFVDKVDHVLAHRRAVDPVNALSSLQAGVLRLQHRYTVNKGRDSMSAVWEESIESVPVLTSTFSTTCLPNEQTLVETVMVMFSWLLYWLLTP